MHRRPAFLLLSLLSLSAACSSAAPAADTSDAAPSDDTAPPPVPVPTECRHDAACAVDSDCGAGARCDTALLPPVCVSLYCLPADAPCSDGVQCQNGFLCAKNKCRRCDTCGDACVDFQSDPANCGSCGTNVTNGHICLDGKSVCNGLDPTSLPSVTARDATSCSDLADTPPPASIPPGTYVLAELCESSDVGALPVPIGSSLQWILTSAIRESVASYESAWSGEDGVVRRMNARPVGSGAAATCFDASDESDPIVRALRAGTVQSRVARDGRIVIQVGDGVFAVFSPR